MKMDTFSRSVVGGIIALSLVSITLPTPTAQAATLAELQAQIQTLLAQITTLQNQLIAMQGGATCFIPQSNFAYGNSGPEVISLQNFLINHGYTIPAGATGYFGTQTQAALQRFQANQGIVPALGYNYGPQTRARIQALCAPAPAPIPTPQPTPQTKPDLRGEASLERFTVNDGDDTDIEEGDNNAELMEVSFRVRDGDAVLNRLEVGFTPDNGNDEKRPWNTFDDVSVWKGNKLLASEDASDEDNWREDSPNDGDYTIRISGLDLVMEEDDEIELTIRTDVQDRVDGTDDGEIWTVFIPDDGLRALDADHAAIYIGDTADAVTINLDEIGASDELIVRRSDEDPDSSVLRLEDNNSSDYLEVFAFDLDTDDSESDIDIREIPIEFTLSSGHLSDFIRKVRLVVDGETYTNETIDDNTDTIIFDFDRGDLSVDAGDRVTAVVEVEFRALDEADEGTTIVAHVDADNIDAEGSEDLDIDQLQGAATGEVHSLYTKGSDVEDTEASAVVTSVDGANNDYVTFEISVDIAAFGQDVYIPIGTSGMTYQLQDSIGNPLVASGTAVVTSSARERNGYFHIPEGNTDSLTLTVTYVPGIPNTTARLQLTSVNYNDTTAAPDQRWLAVPASNYRTPTKVIVN